LGARGCPGYNAMMKRALILTLALAVLLGAGFVAVRYYAYVFAKTVRGEVARVERVNESMIVANPGVPASQLFSFAVSIRDAKGEYHTASSEDRQWAVVRTGQCVEARFYPYPPWHLDKSGTYHGARLIRLFECPPKG
jgi:hypothetical protein